MNESQTLRMTFGRFFKTPVFRIATRMPVSRPNGLRACVLKCPTRPHHPSTSSLPPTKDQTTRDIAEQNIDALLGRFVSPSRCRCPHNMAVKAPPRRGARLSVHNEPARQPETAFPQRLPHSQGNKVFLSRYVRRRPCRFSKDCLCVHEGGRRHLPLKPVPRL